MGCSIRKWRQTPTTPIKLLLTRATFDPCGWTSRLVCLDDDGGDGDGGVGDGNDDDVDDGQRRRRRQYRQAQVFLWN